MNTTNPTLFVVDDDDEVRKSLGRLLRSLGYRVEMFGAADAFLERPSSDGPGCLLLDVHLSDRGGPELQQWLAGAGAALPVIFISGDEQLPSSVQSLRGGAFAFLPKPFEEPILLAAVEQALARDTAMQK